jgi:type VI secretion system secreted protein VgrG
MADDGAASLRFHTDTPDVQTLHVVELTGHEEISSPYRFDLELASRQADVPLEELLRRPARIELRVPIRGGPRGRTRNVAVHGVLSQFEQLDRRNDWVRYRAVLVPKLWFLTRTVQNRVFLDRDLKGIVSDVLEAEVAGRRRFTAEDFEFRASGAHPAREHVVQYQESDFDFVSRRLEHEGVFYFFQQKDEGAKVIFADDRGSFSPLAGEARVPYRPAVEGAGGAPGAEGTLGEEVVRTFVCREQRVAARVFVKDYNYRTPAVPLEATEDVDEKEEGEVYRYGEHFKDEAEGKAIARLRAQEIKCRKRVFSGTSDCRSFRAGQTFTLAEHYRSDFNGDYLLVSVTHRARQPMGAGGLSSATLTYENEFTCIPAAASFRPERRTPVPRIPGFVHALVDAAGDGQYAEVDDDGRYKVKLLLDRSDRADGKASRPVRMAQPYGGADMGFHFPLHKKTEVLLGHALGDPDRPLILSAAPNPETASLVTAPNHTQCKLKSGGNNELRFEDLDGSEHVHLHAQKDLQVVVENDASKSVGHDESATVGNDETRQVDHDRTRKVGNDETVTVTHNQSLSVGSKQEITVGEDRALSVGRNQEITVGADHAQTVGQAIRITAGQGMAVSVQQGDHSLQAGTGNIKMGASAGALQGDAQKIALSAATTLTLAVGGNVIEIGPGGITITAGASSVKLTPGAVEIAAPQISSKASANNEVGAGGQVSIQASGQVSLKGAMITNNS